MGRRVIRVFGPFLVLLALSAVVPASAGAAGEGPGLEVTASGPGGVRFGMSGLEARWRPIAADSGLPRHALDIPGFEAGGGVGGPRVPVQATWILVPPGTEPQLVVHAEEWADGGGRSLALASVPASRTGPEGPRLVDLTLAPGEPLPAGYEVTPEVATERARANRARTGAAVELGETGWWRGRRVAAVRIVPVRHDGAGRVLGVLASGNWEIRFVPDSAAPRPEDPARRLGTANDGRFGGSFLNGDLLARTPTEAAHHGLIPDRSGAGTVAPVRSKSLPATEARLGVTSTRMHRVLAARLREQGLLDDTAVPEDHVRLYQRRYLPALDDGSGNPPWVEIEVPIHMVGEGDDFDGDDFFVFYGLRMRDDEEFTDPAISPDPVPACDDPREWNNSANTYWLAVGDPGAGDPWARMQHITLPAALGQTAANYRRTEYHEEQQAFRGNGQENNDRTYYNHHRASDVSVPLSPQWSPDLAGTTAEVMVQAASRVPRTTTTARVINVDLVRDETLVAPLGNMRMMNVGDLNFLFPDIEPINLTGSTAKLLFTPVSGDMWSYINGVWITYDALYRAVNNRLDFHGGFAAGARPLEVTGFNDADIGLIEVTDPRNPVVVDLGAGNVVDAGGSWTLSVMPDQASALAPRRFQAVGDYTNRGVSEFDYYLAASVDDARSPVQVTASPDLLVVTHADFEGALDRWVQHRIDRSGGDLEVHVVRARDIYDWFGGGLRSPEAIRRLVVHARDHWNTWSVVFVGDANENARELGVRSEARGWSKDWVPTHYHVQNVVGGEWEFMATDKWYVTTDSEIDDYPDRVRSPWEMYTGRIPVNSVDELNRLIDKIIYLETPGENQDWRRRGVFLADDSWSDGYGAEALTTLAYSTSDETFLEVERDSVSIPWADATPVTLESDLLQLADWLDPYFTTDPSETRRSYDVRVETRDGGAGAAFRTALSAGALVAHYQGHANIIVLSSEYWLMDAPNQNPPRRDISGITNEEPFFFFGMGCHIGDWAQDTVTSGTGVTEPSIAEKFLVQSRNGAFATYSSSGYEFIDNIGEFCELMMRRWLRHPPVSAGPGQPARSRWMTGELMWAAEADMLAARGSYTYYREMCTQFVILGDPLAVMDAGPAQVTAVLKGPADQEISGEADIIGLDGTNLRTIELGARDEAGIDRLRVLDSTGDDLTQSVVVMADSLPPNQVDHQEVHYRLQVPVRPFAHAIDVEIWDTGAALGGDRHYTLTLNVNQEADLLAWDEPVDPDVFVFEPEVPVDFRMTVTSASVLNAGLETEVFSADPDFLVLSNENIAYVDERTLDVTFTATAPDAREGERAVVLDIDGYETTWVLQAEEQAGVEGAIGSVYNFPNPMTTTTRFIFETGVGGCLGNIRVFATSGRTVASIPVVHTGGGSGMAEWDGRDNEGDELANGTYLYRVELDAPGGQIVSAVQRLVVMR